MKYFYSLALSLLITISFVNVQNATAQATTTGTETTNTSTTTLPANADQVSDTELKAFIQKAQASGMTDDQIRQAAIAKGMSPGDINKLQSRINIIRTSKDVNSTDITKKVDRDITGDNDKIKSDPAAGGSSISIGGLPLFGSELFNNSNLTFEPNLRIPTPQNYILGPDDQVAITITGNSQADWKLNVNPEGNIQLPNIGLLNVSGKTIEQVTQLIRAKLIANRYAIGQGTSVAVSLGNIRSIKVILVGELTRPGTYTLSSLSTVFNALYASGGPNINGSFRQIQVIRDNAVIRNLDVYDFLLKGSQKDNIRLQDGDIIRVPTYKVRVSLAGQVKRPAVYEVLAGETLRNVINFAGGFTDQAFTATIKVTQVTDQDRRVTDIRAADFDNYIPLRGDSFNVDHILDTYENRVSIYGAVTRPGQFELSKGLTLSQLIIKASGLKPDAFGNRGFISRLKPDNTTELISFDVKGVVNKTAPDILLKREDVVSVPSIFDLRDDYTVSINGEIRNAGQFSYSTDMSVQDLIIQAGGFTQAASPKRIEVARRVTDSDPNQKNSPVAKITVIDVDPDFKVNGEPFRLQPFDVVSIYTLPGYETQKVIKVEGEVLYPGNYTIITKNEKISDIIKRAGGLTIYADIEAGTLKRTNTLGIDASKQKIDANAVQQEKLARITRIQRSFRDSTSNISDQLRNDLVGINLKKITENPGTIEDLIIEDGDVLRIPKEQQLVKINGEVFYPSSVVFDSSKSFAAYVDNAGGYTPYAYKGRAFIVYPNGTVKSTHHVFFFRTHPRVKPGSEIVVPKKILNKGLTTGEFLALFTNIASLGAIIVGLISITRTTK